MPENKTALYISILYAALVLLGTVGELFNVGWIQSLPIFRGP